jgi:hypothetical protein
MASNEPASDGSTIPSLKLSTVTANETVTELAALTSAGMGLRRVTVRTVASRPPGERKP